MRAKLQARWVGQQPEETKPNCFSVLLPSHPVIWPSWFPPLHVLDVHTPNAVKCCHISLTTQVQDTGHQQGGVQVHQQGPGGSCSRTHTCSRSVC